MPLPLLIASRNKQIGSGPRLPADLAKLRDRFLGEYPAQAARVEMLAHVPAAMRYILGLRLELDRTGALPRHYRDLAEAVLWSGPPHGGQSDAVDRLVIDYAETIRADKFQESVALLPQLHHYFTEAQIVELALTLSLARGLAGFDVMLGP